MNCRLTFHKYLFELNIQATRDSVISEVNSVLDQYSYAMVRSTAQVICNTSNNTDYATNLNIDLIIQPLLGVDQFVINITLTS
jgi:hypothetical protein